MAVSGRERAWWIAGASADSWSIHGSVLVCTGVDAASEYSCAARRGMSGMDDMDDMPDMPGMQHGAAVPVPTPEVLAKQLADKRESEFNHHLAGALLILAALFFLAQNRLAAPLAGGTLCVGGVLAVCRIFSAGFQRYGNLAVWIPEFLLRA